MRVLIIHTSYKCKGGEDVVVANEQELLRRSGCIVKSLEFSNAGYTFLKFLLAPFNPFSFVRTYQAICSFNPDIVHLHNWSFAASPSVIWAVKSRKIPLVHTLHNFRIICPTATLSFNHHLYLSSVNSLFPWKSIWRRVFKNSVLSTFWMVFCSRFNYLIGTWQKIDLYIALTKSSKKIFEHSYLKLTAWKIVTKPNFVNEPSLAANAHLRTDNFLYIGRLSEEKGIATLLGAFANSSHKLNIIGDGPLKYIVESFAINNRNVKWLGYKSKLEIDQELSTCTALIFPSVCFETFGMSIIEAFSTGTPVIATNVGSPVDLVQDGINGLYFVSGDHSDLRNQVEKWATLSASQKDIFSVNALDTYAKSYSPKINYKQLLAIYASLKV